MNLKFTNPILPIGEIKIPEEFSMPRLENLKKCMGFYRANGRFDRQIIVDSENYLHDGCCAYITAVLLDVEKVKVLMVGEKPDMGNPVTEPVKEGEPVKLYGIKDYSGWVTKGKIYEFVDGNIRFDEFFGGKLEYESFEKFKEYNTGLSACLVPLVRRPAKVGEWVLVTDSAVDRFIGTVGKVERINSDGNPSVRHKTVWFDTHGDGTENTSMNGCNYLVLDGYHGDPA